MMKIDYSVFDPTGNITVLVHSPVPPERRSSIGKKLLSLEPSSEQVGFLSAGSDSYDIRLEMAGGEFCGNATMSAAVEFLLGKGGRSASQKVRVLCSGFDDPVEVSIQRSSGLVYFCQVLMPPPLCVEDRALPLGGKNVSLPVVFLKGIAHAIVETGVNNSGFDPHEVISAWCDALSTPSLGIMFYENDSLSLTPYVYVSEGGSFYRENSCASGTAALGFYLAKKIGRSVSMFINEPGGVLGFAADPLGEVRVNGNVRKKFSRSVDIGLD